MLPGIHRAAPVVLSLLGLSAVAGEGDKPSVLTFEKDAAPLVRRCEPCHFAGGTMYARLPFDREKTLRSLGTRLFSRIKDEKEREIIRQFLASGADGKAPAESKAKDASAKPTPR
jgi:hypothetical protein